MRSKASIVMCGAVVLVAVLFLSGASPSPRPATQWEYGIYTEFSGNYEWQDAGQRIRATNPTTFFERMGFPTSIEVDARTGRVPAMVLNNLGRQGWELVNFAAAEGKRDVYWFKRPQ